MLKHGLRNFKFPSSTAEIPAFLLFSIQTPQIWISLTLQITGYIAWMYILSREPLAEAVALSGAFFYLITAAVGWLVFDEQLSPLQLAGLIMLSAGIWLMTR